MNEKDRLEVQALIERRSIPEPNSGCWLWDAACDGDGYGRTKWRGHTRPAHRLSFEAFHGVGPGKLSVLHSCDISSCVNPAHLTVGTCGENLREAASKGRMHRHLRSWRVGPGARSTHTFSRVTGLEVTPEALARLVAYNPDTGEFRWLERPGDRGWTRKNAGKIAGSKSQHGKPEKPIFYTRISVFGRDHYAHRLAWCLMTGQWPGKNEVDHRNGDGLDNRWDNLRRATHAQNNHNQGLRRNNLSGVKGVSWDANRNRWFASITVNGKSKALGRFEEFDDAVAARKAAEADYHGEFTHKAGTA